MFITTSLIDTCYNCPSAPTFTSDPNLASVDFCGEQAYFEPLGGSEAIGNGTAPGGNIPTTDICGSTRDDTYDLGSVDIVIVPPVAKCQDVTVGLDVSGNASISPSDIDNGSSASIGISSMGVLPNTFDCDDFGQNTVELTVLDGGGFMSSCSATVTITSPLDNTPPTLTCPAKTLKRNADLMSCDHLAIGTDLDPQPITDDCHIASIVNSFNGSSSLDGSSFPFGKTTVSWTVTDGNGNTATCSYKIRIRDKNSSHFYPLPF